MCFLFAIFQHTFKAVFLYAVLLYTHACTVTWFCRCFAFQIGKICYQKCIVRNFQFRKFLPVYNNYAVTVPPCANSNWFFRCFPDWHNPLPPLYCMEFSVQKIPARAHWPVPNSYNKYSFMVTIQYLHSYVQKSIPDQLRWWDFCLPAYVFLRSAQQVRRPTEQLRFM